MVNISRLFFRTTGLMPRKEIVRTCKNIGAELGKDCKPGDNIDITKLKNLMVQTIGKKKANKIVISDNFETFKKYTASLGLDEQTSEMLYYGSKSAVLPNPKDKSILLSLRTADMETGEALNTSMHEMEHVLFKILSPHAAIEKLYTKLRGQKWIDKYVQKYGQLINEKNYEMQSELLFNSRIGYSAIGGFTEQQLNKQGLLNQMSLPSIGALQQSLKKMVQDLLSENNPKQNIKILKYMKAILKDESRAYKVGGTVEHAWTDAIGKSNPNATKSELLAMLYDETLPVVKKEIRNQKLQRIKSFFGIKSNPKLEGAANTDGSQYVH